MVMNNNIDTAANAIVQLNNGALSHFINRDYEKAIIMLRRAYEVFEVCSQLQDLKNTSESSSSSSSSAMDMDTDTTASSAPSSSSAIHSSSIQADSSENSNIQFMQYDMNGDDDSDAVSSSSSTQEHQQGQQQQQQQQLPTARKLGGLGGGGVDFEMDSTLFKEKVVRSSQVEPTANYACSPDTAYSMYNRALVLSDEENNVYSLIIGNNKYRTAAIILYNLALVHHTIGIQLGLSAALPHAIRLYEMALESIILGCCSCSISTATTQSSSSIPNLSLLGVEKLFMALLNNLGNIYTHMFEYENAQRCFNHLRVVLSAFGRGSSSSRSAIAAADEEYTFFFLNAIFQGKELCIAPAA